MIDSPVQMQNNRSAIQEDGKIVMAGTYYYYVLPSFDLVYELRIMRFLQDGRRDSTFNGNGLYTRNTIRSTRLAALNIQPDGKILISGSRGLLERYLPSGIPDSSFNDSAQVILKYLGPYDYIAGTTVQPDGKIVVTGRLDQQYLLVARFKPDGRTDSTFGFYGKVNTTLDSAAILSGAGVAVQQDGKIVAAGAGLFGIGPYKGYFLVVRYLVDGGLDPTFNNGKGYIKLSLPGLQYGGAQAVQLLSGGKILIGGTAYNPGTGNETNQYQCIAKLTSAGIPDSSYNGTGILVADFVSRLFTGQGEGPFVKLHPSGRAYLSSPTGGQLYNQYFSMLCLDSAGRADSTFGNGGRVVTDLTANEDIPWDIAVQKDGKVLLAGVADRDSSWPQPLHSLPALVRYIAKNPVVIPPEDTIFVDFIVYPNPASDRLILRYTLNAAKDLSIQLHSIGGQLVKRWSDHASREKGIHKELLELPGSIAAGNYILTVIIGDERREIKIVKK
jgi:uncharacterized delta-60 repeat protein